MSVIQAHHHLPLNANGSKALLLWPWDVQPLMGCPPPYIPGKTQGPLDVCARGKHMVVYLPLWLTEQGLLASGPHCSVEGSLQVGSSLLVSIRAENTCPENTARSCHPWNKQKTAPLVLDSIAVRVRGVPPSVAHILVLWQMCQSLLAAGRGWILTSATVQCWAPPLCPPSGLVAGPHTTSLSVSAFLALVDPQTEFCIRLR